MKIPNPKFQIANSSVTRATALIALFALLSKLAGLAREAILSNRLGASSSVDAYVAAFRIPDFIFNLLVFGTLSVAFLPVFVEYLQRDRESAWRTASTILNLTVIAILACATVAFLFSDALVSLIAPGFDAEQRALTAQMTRVMLLSPLFFSVSSVLSSIAHSFKRFAAAAAAPLIYNLAIIFGILVLLPVVGPLGIAIGVVLGAFLHMLMQLPAALCLGFRWKATVSITAPAVKKFFTLFLPRLFTIDPGQTGLFIASIIGSFLSEGALAVFSYANNLQTIPLALFAVPFAVAVFPTLSELFERGDHEAFRSTLTRTIIQMLFIIGPISALLLVERAQIVRLVLGAGEGTAFTFADTRRTAQALAAFSFSIFAQALLPLLARAFYAQKNTKVPVVVNTIGILLNIAFAILLVRRFEVGGLALAYSLAVMANTVILFILLQRRIGIFPIYFWKKLVQIGAASSLALVGAYAGLYLIAPLVDMTSYGGILIQTVGAGAIGVAIYLGIAVLLGMQEVRYIRSIFRYLFEKLGLNGSNGIR